MSLMGPLPGIVIGWCLLAIALVLRDDGWMLHAAWVFLALGTLFNINAIPVNTGWALAAAWMADRAHIVKRSLRWLDRAAGLLFVGFGLKLALTENPVNSAHAP